MKLNPFGLFRSRSSVAELVKNTCQRTLAECEGFKIAIAGEGSPAMMLSSHPYAQGSQGTIFGWILRELAECEEFAEAIEPMTDIQAVGRDSSWVVTEWFKQEHLRFIVVFRDPGVGMRLEFAEVGGFIVIRAEYSGIVIPERGWNPWALRAMMKHVGLWDAIEARRWEAAAVTAAEELDDVDVDDTNEVSSVELPVDDPVIVPIRPHQQRVSTEKTGAEEGSQERTSGRKFTVASINCAAAAILAEREAQAREPAPLPRVRKIVPKETIAAE